MGSIIHLHKLGGTTNLITLLGHDPVHCCDNMSRKCYQSWKTSHPILNFLAMTLGIDVQMRINGKLYASLVRKAEIIDRMVSDSLVRMPDGGYKSTRVKVPNENGINLSVNTIKILSQSHDQPLEIVKITGPNHSMVIINPRNQPGIEKCILQVPNDRACNDTIYNVDHLLVVANEATGPRGRTGEIYKYLISANVVTAREKYFDDVDYARNGIACTDHGLVAATLKEELSDNKWQSVDPHQAYLKHLPQLIPQLFLEYINNSSGWATKELCNLMRSEETQQALIKTTQMMGEAGPSVLAETCTYVARILKDVLPQEVWAEYLKRRG